MNIAIIPRVPPAMLSSDEAAAGAAAIQKLVLSYFGPAWTISAVIGKFDGSPPTGYIPVYIDSNIQAPDGLSGYHTTQNGYPYGEVQFGPSWTLAASHECLELLVDTYGTTFVPGVAPNDASQPVRYLKEVCDPCQDASCGHPIDGFLVSDFCLPSYFDVTAPEGTQLTWQGKIATPLDVAPGGSQYWLDSDNQFYQRINVNGDYQISCLGQYSTGPLGCRQWLSRAAKSYSGLSHASGNKRLITRLKKARRDAAKAAQVAFRHVELDRDRRAKARTNGR
jgi:hypothetical protein